MDDFSFINRASNTGDIGAAILTHRKRFTDKMEVEGNCVLNCIYIICHQTSMLSRGLNNHLHLVWKRLRGRCRHISTDLWSEFPSAKQVVDIWLILISEYFLQISSNIKTQNIMWGCRIATSCKGNQKIRYTCTKMSIRETQNRFPSPIKQHPNIMEFSKQYWINVERF